MRISWTQPSVSTPIQITPAPSDTPKVSRLPTLHDFFAPGGILSRSSLAFEHRNGQYEMARAVEQAFADKRHLIVEAGTGTGKTLAYLLPALRLARERSSASSSPPAPKTCRSSSSSRTSLSSNHPRPAAGLLHEGPRQLPLQAQALCPARPAAAVRPRRDQPVPRHRRVGDDHRNRRPRRDRRPARELRALAQARRARRSLPRPDLPRLRALLHHRDAPQGARVRPRHRQPPSLLRRSRHQAAGRRRADAGMLPEAAAVIFDEAHELEEVASQLLRHRPQHAALRRTRPRHRDHAAREAALTVRSTSAAPRCATAPRSSSPRCPAKPSASPLGRMPFDQREAFLEESRRHLHRRAATRSPASKASSSASRMWRRSPACASAPPTSATHLKFLLESTDPNTVFWIERRTSRRAFAALRAAPPVAPPAAPHLPAGHAHRRLASSSPSTLFEQYSSVILTSATLTVPRPAVRLRPHPQAPRPDPARANSSSPRTSTTPSRRSSTCRPTCPTRATPTSCPRPPSAPAACSRSPAAAPSASSPATRRCATCTNASCAELPYPLLLQGTAPRNVLLEQFRDTPNAVLFGTSTSGRASTCRASSSSCVIIDRLPFAVPSDPVVKARMDAIEDRRRQPLLRLPGPHRRHHPQTGLRPPHPLARRPRRAHAARPAHPAPALRPHLPRLPAALPPDPRDHRRRAVLR